MGRLCLITVLKFKLMVFSLFSVFVASLLANEQLPDVAREQATGCIPDGPAELSPVDTKAKLIHMIPVSSGMLSHLRMGNAIVVVKIRIDEDGRVGCMTLVAGHPIVAAAVIDSVKQWRFRSPAVRDRPRSVWGRLVIRVGNYGRKTTVLDHTPRAGF